MKRTLGLLLVAVFVFALVPQAFAVTIWGTASTPYRSGSYARSYAATQSSSNMSWLGVKAQLREKTSTSNIIRDSYNWLYVYNFTNISGALRYYLGSRHATFYTTGQHSASNGWSQSTTSSFAYL